MSAKKQQVTAIPSDTPWPTPEQVNQTIALSGRSFKDLSMEDAISAVILAYKANAMKRAAVD
jgi:hypothetical protein